MNPIVILGSNGQVGYQLKKDLSKKYFIHALSKDDCDISNINHLTNTLEKLNPSIVINAAAFTDVDGAEKNPSNAYKINAESVENLSKLSHHLNFTLIHFSTDYVFNKSSFEAICENEALNPINIYGNSKLLGENAILKYAERFYIFRISWVYGRHGKNFPKTIIKLAREKEEIKIVNDQFGSPTSTFLISHVLDQIVDMHLNKSVNKFGIYHLSPNEYCSWFDIGKVILQKFKNNPEFRLKKIIPTTSEEFASVAKRPNFSYLDNSKIKKSFGIKINNWMHYLNEFLKYYD